MPKVNDYKEYFAELATKSGLDPAKAQQVLDVLGDAQIEQAFRQGFKALPDYSSDLDAVRSRTEKEITDRNQKWYDDNLKVFNEAERIVKTVRGDQPPVVPDPQATAGLTREQIAELVRSEQATALAARDAAYTDYVEIREENMREFGKPLDRKAFESFYEQNPEVKRLGLRDAYQRFIAPEVQKINEAKAKAEADRRYEEGVRDGMSKRGLPGDAGPREFSPMFDKKLDVAQMTPEQKERHSREAFIQGYREAITNKTA